MLEKTVLKEAGWSIAHSLIDMSLHRHLRFRSWSHSAVQPKRVRDTSWGFRHSMCNYNVLIFMARHSRHSQGKECLNWEPQIWVSVQMMQPILIPTHHIQRFLSQSLASYLDAKGKHRGRTSPPDAKSLGHKVLHRVYIT